jgi:hypothetical protein
MDKTELLRINRQDAFVRGNGSVLRTINLLKPQYTSLSTVGQALDALSEDIYVNCLNYLSLEGYIALRTMTGHMDANAEDLERYGELEAKLSAKGVRLLAGAITDSLVRV